jgi:predicted nucleotidyltransferase
VKTLADASLRPEERRALERFAASVREELGEALRAVWVYGSRARGEPIRPESDVDVIVVSDGGWDDWDRVGALMDRAASAEGADAAYFAVHVYDPAHIAHRREIGSFFIQEVDRDKIVLAGEP